MTCKREVWGSCLNEKEKKKKALSLASLELLRRHPEEDFIVVPEVKGRLSRHRGLYDDGH